MSSDVKTHRMFCTSGTVCYKQHDGNFSEVIFEDACIRDSVNVFVRFFLKPQGKFHDENMQNNYSNSFHIPSTYQADFASPTAVIVVSVSIYHKIILL